MLDSSFLVYGYRPPLSNFRGPLQIEVAEAPGPKNARKIWITVTVRPLSVDKKFRRLGFSILEKELDADFTSTDPKQIGLRDAKKWAKEVRGQIHEKPFLRFNVSEAEIPHGYIVVHFNLPQDGGSGVFGTYYLLLKELRNVAPPPREPAPLERKGAP